MHRILRQNEAKHGVGGVGRHRADHVGGVDVLHVRDRVSITEVGGNFVFDEFLS
jgi:hypothetical protein